MNIGDIPLFSMLRQRLGYLSEREQVIAQNVANADTPGYVGRDLKPFSFQSRLNQQTKAAGTLAMVQPSQTQAAHLPGKAMKSVAGGLAAAKGAKTTDSETTLDGNSVVLEDQMIKMNETRMEYEAAIGFYQKSLSMLRMAARPPGR
jgi:flagellar basal-body rod protein FlgB